MDGVEHLMRPTREGHIIISDFVGIWPIIIRPSHNVRPGPLPQFSETLFFTSTIFCVFFSQYTLQ